ncbi:MAG: hypothetical protein OEO77_08220 [Acidimicrobiia bacterium]|nr:hypothetical protein [Acidimicrobiia bacterium]
MSTLRAFVLAMLIVAYFVAATVWLPDFVLRTEPLAGIGRTGRDLMASGTWAIGLWFGMITLRRAQGRGKI